jgi:hypothetical protein
MKWIYRGEEIDSLPDEVNYFVYKIDYTNGTSYIGSKVVRSELRTKPLVGMRKNAKRVSRKESNWKTYVGSSKLNAGLAIALKEILHLCSNKRSSTYLEHKELFCRGAIESRLYNNANIGGKFFDNCLDGLLTYEKIKLPE